MQESRLKHKWCVCATTQQLNQPCTYTKLYFLISLYLDYNKNISDYQIKPGPLLFWDLASCAATMGSQVGFAEFIGLQSDRSNPSSDVLVGNAGYLWLHHAADVRIQPMWGMLIKGFGLLVGTQSGQNQILRKIRNPGDSQTTWHYVVSRYSTFIHAWPRYRIFTHAWPCIGFG